MMWLMVNIKIWLREQNQIKFEDIKLLKSQVIQNGVSKMINLNGLQDFW